MTSPATEPASTPVTAGTPVLSARPLFYKIPPADLPRFGDDRWDLWAAVRDQHYAHAICWAQYPEPFREDAKLYALTLLTAVDDAPCRRTTWRAEVSTGKRAEALVTVWGRATRSEIVPGQDSPSRAPSASLARWASPTLDCEPCPLAWLAIG
jgi:hypothetical protein